MAWKFGRSKRLAGPYCEPPKEAFTARTDLPATRRESSQLEFLDAARIEVNTESGCTLHPYGSQVPTRIGLATES